MDEKFLESIENIAGNVEYLIKFLEKKSNKDDDKNSINSLDVIENNFSSYNTILNDIKNATVKNGEVLTGYMQKLDDIDGALNDDFEVENMNLMLNEMISKIDELKVGLENLGVDYEMSIDNETIDEIREKLENGLTLDISVDSINEINNFKDSIQNLQSNIDEFQNMNNLIDFSKWISDIKNVKESLESLKDVDLENIDLNVLGSENIDQIINNLTSLKDSVGDLEVQNNLNEIEESLEKIKNIDIKTNLESIKDELENINDISIKADIEIPEESKDVDLNMVFNDDNVISQIDQILETLKSDFIVDLEIRIKDDVSDRLNELEAEINNFINDIPALVLNTDIDIKTEKDLILESLETELNGADVTITPDIDLTSEIDRINEDGIDLNLNPNIEIDESNIGIEDNSPNIKYDNNSNDKMDKLLDAIEKNNEMLNNLTKIVNDKLSIESETETVSGDTEVSVIDESNSIAKVNPIIQETETEELKVLKNILSVMQNLSSTNSKLLIEQLKSKFSGDINI